MTVFGPDYAGAYDALYGDKDYGAECKLIESLIHKHLGRAETIVDFGCGTGSHAIPLAERGYQVWGFDRSAAMLQRAREKAAASPAHPRLRFLEGDIQHVRADVKADAALLMFAVLGYQVSNRAVLDALRTARAHLRPGGLLIFDVWYGPAVLSIRPGDRVKTVDTGGRRLVRMTKTDLDTIRDRCRVHFHTLEIEGDRLMREAKEAHDMRYFFAPQLEMFLEMAGFENVGVLSWDDPASAASERDWNVLVTARATAEGA